MTSNERVLAAINFSRPDSVPTWFGYGKGLIEDWRKHTGAEPGFGPGEHYGRDVEICVADESFFPSQRKKLSEDAHHEVRNDGWGRIVRTGKHDVYFSEALDRVLKKRSDLDRIEFEPAGLDTRYTALSRKVEAVKAAGRCKFAKIGGLYVRTHFLRGEENLLVDMATDRSFCNALFDKVADHFIGIALETLRRTDCWETGLFVYDDMANAKTTMFSPAMFELYMLPRYKRIINVCRSAGCRHFFFHSDGNLRPVLDLLLDAGFEGFHPLEPRCGMDILNLRKRYGRRMVLFGGVCNTRILPGGERGEVKAHLLPLIELAREGGVVLGSGSIESDVAPETVDFLWSVIREYGRFNGSE